jgi:23S rRNA (guanosine2251-2'-O)-methyltransferase
MYNDRMKDAVHEIRVCESCGLRYPLVESHPFGTRCPACMGETRVVLRRQLTTESMQRRPPKTVDTLAVLLDNIRSAWNVGSILRSADGFGFTHAYLCGITPAASEEAVRKTSLGAEQSVPWSHHKDALQLVRDLKDAGWKVYALEEDERAAPLPGLRTVRNEESKEEEKRIIVLGNEVTGVDPALLELCDQILYIPMHGEKRSFNVAIAFGIAAYALTQERP